MFTTQEIAAFWARVDRSGGPDACWPWMAGTTKNGDGFAYGIVRIRWKRYRSHRLAYELTYGPIPPDLLVCHHCDYPLCCNPLCLFLGTKADNNEDKTMKGRATGAKGLSNGRGRLSDQDIQTMRERYRRGETITNIARDYNLDRKYTSLIVNYKARI